MKNACAEAPSVVATLWSVNDMASEKLIVDFYKNLNQHHAKDKALALAQHMMIEQNDQYAHPAMWAGYITIGKN
ncbi:CHAT domain-containing protein [Sphingobacterium sp. DN00404]|uniref:CHAT domain-containing protein n=1 Tax=Sphingobacterium micropteri TaxID=2763501 RepID=A0ABR7YRY8_9SPHI|nr:CHAT domain-containing protein [Sphingobacterium micropteri]MBD1434123.1 CHAT domain-containing protein [Sphingobacterium micropteri]